MPPMKTEKTPWRSPEHKARIEAGLAEGTREFTGGESALSAPIERRDLLKTAGAMAAMLGAASCGLVRRPEESIQPYSVAPEDAAAGKPLFYATAMAVGEDVTGLLVESHEGRPTKVEGNPLHPASLGATSARHQAWVLDLYDPDRLRRSLHEGLPVDPSRVAQALDDIRAKLLPNGGEGSALLLPSVTSPSLLRAVDLVRASFPKLALHRYEPLTLDTAYAASITAFGREVLPRPEFARADVILSCDGDFLGSDPFSVANTRAFASRRDPRHPRGMNRLWAMEGAFTITGAAADHRMRVPRSRIPAALAQLFIALSRLDAGVAAAANPALAERLRAWAAPAPLASRELNALAQDLLGARGRGAVVVGPRQGVASHLLGTLLNQALGNLGTTIAHAPRPFAGHPLFARGPFESLAALAASAREGRIQTLFILGGDPVHTAPRDLDLPSALKKIPSIITLSDRKDHTAALAHWAIARSHGLEGWGDAVTVDGRASILQPLITPLGESFGEIEVLTRLAGAPAKAADFVRRTWPSLAAEGAWRKALHDGILEGEDARVAVSFDGGKLGAFFKDVPPAPSLELSLDGDPALHDGRFANHAWLQETPNPISKHTWGNALWISPALAAKLGAKNGEVLAIAAATVKIPFEAPVWVAPGQADESVSLTLGHGQKTIGRLGEGWGVDGYALLSTTGSFTVAGVTLKRTGKHVVLASVQDHQSLEGRDLYRETDAAHAEARPHTHGEEHAPGSEDDGLVATPKSDAPNQWGMVVDLGKCTGCNACLVGCQAENNIPAVGREGVLRGREMHWIRLDRYFTGEASEARLVTQPVACVQCEAAPCEQVCPVNATSHSREGLSDIAYNRCIGMRYCANNCPYKARRFNFLDWHQESPQSAPKKREHLFDLFRESEAPVKMQRNPDVTVRMRGVMEKCTYCVQRINAARAAAPRDGQPLPEGSVTTACQQACPAGAIEFGNLLDPKSRVRRLKELPRQYALLGELGVKPRTTYLAAVRNPHPDLKGA
ncbi:MAG: 4Fe-4S dicluster domain-containing protein [Spirochaetes bacterium]|nr:4Fe-4S dicluster domain-containing protein [Spirochaetota bacterium]